MAHQDRINKLVLRLSDHRQPYGPETWNDEQIHKPANHWMRPEIGIIPQSARGHILKMIDEEIRQEETEGSIKLLKKMLEYMEQPTFEEEEILKASGYLCIDYKWGRKLLDPDPVVGRTNRTKLEIIHALKSLVHIGKFNWLETP